MVLDGSNLHRLLSAVMNHQLTYNL